MGDVIDYNDVCIRLREYYDKTTNIGVLRIHGDNLQAQLVFN